MPSDEPSVKDYINSNKPNGPGGIYSLGKLSPTLANADSIGVYLGSRVDTAFHPNETALTDREHAGMDSAARFAKQKQDVESGMASLDEAKAKFNDPNYFSDSEKGMLGQALARVGIIDNPGNMQAIQNQWEDAVAEAAQRLYHGQVITPMQVLANRINFARNQNQGTSATSRTDTTTNFSIPSVEDAHALVKNIFQQALGRDPTDNELAKYSSMAVGIAKSNPSTSTTETTRDKNGNTSSHTTTTQKSVGAAGMQDAILTKLQADPEYGAYQAATTYFNAVMQMLGESG